jgi:hypothetical protein
MRKKRLLFVLFIFMSVFIIGYLFLKPSFNYLSGYLAKSEQVNANILIVEGWLPDYGLEMAYNESKKNSYDRIITTGIKSSTEYFRLAEDGYLIFYPRNRLSGISGTGPHSIEIDAYSELGGENRAHFNLYINDSLAGDFFAEKQKKRFKISWDGYLKEIDSIMVEFNNDFMGDFGDRNLFIKDIIIDRKITIPYLNNSEYDVAKLDGKRRFINNYFNNAELAKRKLIGLGIDSSLITSVSGGKARINRTLTSALAFRDWLKTKEIKVNGIKIISMGTHARRTWMTYNKILDEKYKIGIISLPDYKNSYSRKNRILKTIRETLGIIYYWLILIPY